MDPTQLTQTFAAAGYDSPEKLAAFLAQFRLSSIDSQLAAMQEKKRSIADAATYAINQDIDKLRVERAAALAAA